MKGKGYAEEMSNFHDPILSSCTDGLLAFQSVSDLDSIPNLRDYDIDEQLPTSIQSQYYSVSELASLETKSQDLSILHTNVRSLSCHHEISFLFLEHQINHLTLWGYLKYGTLKNVR